MPVERSAGILFFRNTPQGRRYLVIRSSYHRKDGKHNFWDVPKGLLEKEEKGIDAAKREAQEEVGIKDMDVKLEFRETVRYFVKRDRDKKAVLKFVAMFLAEVKNEEVKLSWEHDQYEWLPYKEARDKLTRDEMKMVLGKAEKYFER